MRVTQFLRDQFACMPRRQQFMRRLDMLPRPSQRIDVPRACGKRTFRRGMKADAVLEVLAQAVETCTRTGAQVDARRAAQPASTFTASPLRSILLNTSVSGTFAGTCCRSFSIAAIAWGSAASTTNSTRSAREDLVAGTPDALGFDVVRGLAQSCRVQDVQRQAIDRDAFTQYVSRRRLASR